MWNKDLLIWLSLLFGFDFIMSQSLPKNLVRRTKFDEKGTNTYFPKAINGEILGQNEFVTFVSVQLKDGKHMCGGMLLDVDFVVTSASCLSQDTPAYRRYQASELQVNNDAVNDTTKIKAVKRLFFHPEFNTNTLDNDIAILNIESYEWLPAMETLTAIETPERSNNCEVIGWGKAEGGEAYLQKINVEMHDSEECSKLYTNQNDKKLCVEGKQQSCLEEPGSGLVCNGELAGILSYGTGCDERVTRPNVFVDMSKYNIWIDEVFRTTLSDDEQSNQGVNNLNKINPTTDRTTTSTTTRRATTTTTTTRRSTTRPTSRPVLQPSPTVPGTQQWSNELGPGKVSYDIVVETCQLPFTTCINVWSGPSTKVICKRGYFPYGCFHVVKTFVRTDPIAVKENNDEERLKKFLVFLKQRPLKQLHSVANLIQTSKAEAEKKLHKFPPKNRFNAENHPIYQNPSIWNPNIWFQQTYCWHAITVSRYNQINGLPYMTNIPGCEQYVEALDLSIQDRGQFDVSPISTTKDPRIYFPQY